MLIHKIYDLLVLIAFIIGLVRFKKLASPFKILTCSVGVTILLEILSLIFIKIYGTNALIYHLMSISAYIFYAVAYSLLFKDRRIKKAIMFFIPVIFSFFLVNILFLQQPSDKQFPTNIYLITNILYVIFSLLMFKQMLQQPSDSSITKQSIFWFNSALLFFSTTMFLNMGLLNYYASHKWPYDTIYYLWEGNFCLFNALICVSLLIDNQKTVEMTKE